MADDSRYATLVEDSYAWLRAAARGFRRCNHGSACPSVEELVNEGAVTMMQLAPRYDPNRGAAFTTFCYQHVLSRWRTKAFGTPSSPTGGSDAVLGLLRVEGSVLDGDAEHLRHTSALADTFIAARTIDDLVDLRSILAFVEQLPPPQPQLVQGIFQEGKSLTELMAELKLNRGQARWGLQKAMANITNHFTDTSA